MTVNSLKEPTLSSPAIHHGSEEGFTNGATLISHQEKDTGAPLTFLKDDFDDSILVVTYEFSEEVLHILPH